MAIKMKRGTTDSWKLGPELVDFGYSVTKDKDSVIRAEGTELEMYVYTESANEWWTNSPSGGGQSTGKIPGLPIYVGGKRRPEDAADERGVGCTLKIYFEAPSDCTLECLDGTGSLCELQFINYEYIDTRYNQGSGNFPQLFVKWPAEKVGTAEPIPIKIRVSLRENWLCEELEEGQLGLEYTEDGNVKVKAGMPGTTKWNELPYIGTGGGGDSTKVLVVMAELNEQGEPHIASHTPKQIYDHVQSGGVAWLSVGGIFYNLFHANEEGTVFVTMTDDLIYLICEINAACECSLYDESLVSQRGMRSNLMQVITVGENNVPSMTSQEIYNLVQNGGQVVLKYNNQMYSLASCTEGSAYFNYCDDEHTIYCIEIANNQIYIRDNYIPATLDWVLGQLDPINEALEDLKDKGLPTITTDDNGKLLQVVDGKPAWAEANSDVLVVSADWDIVDESNPAAIKNKPFGEVLREQLIIDTTLYFEEPSPGAGAIIASYNPTLIQPNTSCKIWLDGEYLGEHIADESAHIVVDGVISFQFGILAIYGTNVAGDHHVRVSGWVVRSIKMDSKYLNTQNTVDGSNNTDPVSGAAVYSMVLPVGSQSQSNNATLNSQVLPAIGPIPKEADEGKILTIKNATPVWENSTSPPFATLDDIALIFEGGVG